MCDPIIPTTLDEMKFQIRKAMSCLYMHEEIIPGKENEELMADKYLWIEHAHEHLIAALSTRI